MDNHEKLYQFLKKNVTETNIKEIFKTIFNISPLIIYDLDKVSYNKHKGRYNKVLDAMAISQFKIDNVDDLHTQFITPGLKYYIRILFYKKYVKIPYGVKIRIYKHDPKKQKEDGTRPKAELETFIRDLIKYDPLTLYNLEKGLFDIV